MEDTAGNSLDLSSEDIREDDSGELEEYDWNQEIALHRRMVRTMMTTRLQDALSESESEDFGTEHSSDTLYKKSGGISRASSEQTSQELPTHTSDHAGMKKDNPYLLLPEHILKLICTDRDVRLVGTLSERAEQLAQYDEICSDWLDTIMFSDDSTLQHLNAGQLYMYAAIHGIKLDAMPMSIGLDALRGVIRVLMICKKIHPTPNQRMPVLYQGNDLTITIDKLLSLSRGGIYVQSRHLTSSTIRTLRGIYSEGYNNAFEAKLPVILMQLAKYPVYISEREFSSLTTIATSSIRLALQIMRVNARHIDFMTRAECVFTISRGYLPNPSVELSEQIKRYETIERYSSEVRSLLISLYGTGGDEKPLIKVAISPIHSLESVIILIGTKSAQDVARHVGMIIPPSQDPDIYLQSNILEYKHLFTRQIHTWPTLDILRRMNYLDGRSIRTFLEHYTDVELFQHLQIYVPYTSRANLIDRLSRCLREESFFVPLQRSSVNKETQLWTSTSDMSVFMVAFGIPISSSSTQEDSNVSVGTKWKAYRELFASSITTGYTCYEMDEFLGSFCVRDDGGFVFSHPDNPKKTFTLNQVEDLLHLLKNYPEADAVVRRIEEGIIELKDRTKDDIEWLKTFRKLSTSDQKNIREWLLRLFATGMYMRRWKGAGHPYPVAKADTEIKIDPEPQVKSSLGVLVNISASMSKEASQFVEHLTCVEYRSNTAIRSGLKAIDLIHSVGEGRRCIRQASSIAIGTAYYYLCFFFKEKVERFDICSLDIIS